MAYMLSRVNPTKGSSQLSTRPFYELQSPPMGSVRSSSLEYSSLHQNNFFDWFYIKITYLLLLKFI